MQPFVFLVLFCPSVWLLLCKQMILFS